MKVLTQNFKNGELTVAEYPTPSLPSRGALVATSYSAVSLGTEKGVYQLAQANPIQKARKRPDLVKQVWNRAKNDGLINTISIVRNLVSEPIPLGYSISGSIIQTGYRCGNLQPGDRVVCAGFEYANHAEVNAVPNNLICKIPVTVSEKDAAFATIGSVALHALRVADVKTGETVLIMGLGLLGHLCAALATIGGAIVIGYDPQEQQVSSAKNYCPEGYFFSSMNALVAFKQTTSGYGADYAIVCASSGSKKMFTAIGDLIKDRGQVIIVGDVNCSIPRRLYYEKELQVKFSRAYGPGRYDPNYEKKGVDYPYGYVRWTMQRNIAEVLRLLEQRRLAIQPLITHEIEISEAADELEKLFKGSNEQVLGISIYYPTATPISDTPIQINVRSQKLTSEELCFGIVGAGKFGQGILLPAFRKAGAKHFKKIATSRGISAVSAARKFHIEQAVSNVGDIFEDDDINTVIILTSHGQHAELIAQGLAKNKHVFCEKPLALTSNDLETIVELEKKSTGILMVGFNRRFSPFLVKLKSAISFSKEPMHILYRINAGVQAPDVWVHDERLGGGRIIGEVCHYVDVANFLVESHPISLHAYTLTGDRSDKTYYDTVSATIKYENGSVVTINFVANGNTNFSKEYLEVHRAESSAILDNYRKLNFKGPTQSFKFRKFNQNKGFLEEALAFLQGCKNGTPPIPIGEMIMTTEITFAIMQSIASNEVIYFQR